MYDHILGHDVVVMWTGAEILDWYRTPVPADAGGCGRNRSALEPLRRADLPSKLDCAGRQRGCRPRGICDMSPPDGAPSELKAPTFDEMVEGIRRGAAEAVREAHALGLPVFESDSRAVYAIYPDGRRVVVEHLPDGRRRRSVSEPDHT
jgi:hypothetical protein